MESEVSRKRVTLVIVVLVLLGAGVLFVSDQHLKAKRWEREAHFVTLHLEAEVALSEGGDSPLFFESLVTDGQHNTVPLMRPFPDGLVFKWNGSSFTLEEPRARFVSLLKKDRLIATERKWPRWERSGEYARKFPGQAVPGDGYE